MTEPFTDEWTQRVESATAELSSGEDVSFSCTVQGGPDGDVPIVFRYRSGSLRVAVEVDEEADVVATIPWNDAMTIVRGELRPTVAYMRGKLKPSGNMEQCLRLLELSESGEFRSAVAAL